MRFRRVSHRSDLARHAESAATEWAAPAAEDATTERPQFTRLGLPRDIARRRERIQRTPSADKAATEPESPQ